MRVGKFTSILLALLSVTSWLLATDKTKQKLTFSRPTVKGIVLSEAPPRFRTIYKDQPYEFVVSDKSTGEVDESALFAHDFVGERWILITELSTENAKLGKSYNRTGDKSDFRGLANSDYAHIPVKVRRTKMLPDRVTFDQNNQLYQVYFNYQFNLSITVSTFWVSKNDLDAVQ